MIRFIGPIGCLQGFNAACDAKIKMHLQAGSGFYIQRRRAVRSPADNLFLYKIQIVVIKIAHLKKPADGRVVMAYRLLFNSDLASRLFWRVRRYF